MPHHTITSVFTYNIPISNMKHYFQSTNAGKHFCLVVCFLKWKSFDFCYCIVHLFSLFQFFEIRNFRFYYEIISINKKNTAKMLSVLDSWYWPADSNRQIDKFSNDRQSHAEELAAITGLFPIHLSGFFWDFVTLHICNGRKKKWIQILVVHFLLLSVEIDFFKYMFLPKQPHSKL